MCNQHHATSCSGCGHGLNRRGFLRGCGAAVVSGGLLAAAGRPAAAEPARKARVGLVFLSNSSGREMWPYPDFDTTARENEIMAILREGCPAVEFVPVVVPGPADLQKAVAIKDQVDGYLVYTTTLDWSLTGPVVEIGKLGKPTLVADEYLGGSGVFLIGLSMLRRQGIPAAAVSSTRPADLVAVARHFADVLSARRLRPPRSPHSAEATYRRTFAQPEFNGLPRRRASSIRSGNVSSGRSHVSWWSARVRRNGTREFLGESGVRRVRRIRYLRPGRSRSGGRTGHRWSSKAQEVRDRPRSRIARARRGLPGDAGN